MPGTEPKGNHSLRFDVSDRPPHGLAALLALQTVLLSVAGIVLTPVIVLRGAGVPQTEAPGIIFYALMISGVTTLLQARKVWRFGSGYILLMGTSGAFIAVCISALRTGGMPLMMTLISASALVQFLFANHLGFLRKLITPLVGGIAVMLIAVTVMPIVFTHFPATTEDGMARPTIAFVTLSAIVLLSFFGGRRLRLWAPVLGVILGTLLAWSLGEWDLTPVVQAPWFGLPDLTWPGFDLSFGTDFWMLLPAFTIITVVGAIETYGDAIAIQQVSHRKTEPIDYRTVQGALYADGLGNLLSGIFGTVPNTTYSTSISVVDMTGVAARKVGIFCGIFIIILALFPKLIAVILSIPQPVVGSYMLVLILLLFTHGLKLVTEQGMTFERCMVIGMGFWLGTGFQQQAFFHALIPPWLAPITDNGMTAGTVATLILTGILALNPGKKSVLKTRFSIDSLPESNAFIRQFARQNNWPARVRNRLQLAVEETLLSLIQIREKAKTKAPSGPRTLRLELKRSGRHVDIEMAVLPADKNLMLLIDAARMSEETAPDHLSLKILGSLATEFHHSQFHGTDFITMKVRTDR